MHAATTLLADGAPGSARRAAPFLPMSRAEMEKLGWDECDVIVVFHQK